MKVALQIFSSCAYKEYVLPTTNNSETRIVLKNDMFGVKDTVELKLEVLNFKWRFLEGDYSICHGQEMYAGAVLGDQENYTIFTKNGDKLYVTVQIQESHFFSYLKYALSNVDEISIGSDGQSVLQYSYFYSEYQFVSGLHALLKRENDGWLISDFSKNGTFLNNRRIHGKNKLEFGDHVNIWGLDIIFLDDFLAVDKNVEVNVKDSILMKWQNRNNILSSNHTEAKWNEKVYYHRSPRNMEPLATESIEIEAPPAPKEENTTPLFMQIGPAMTMMLPMLVGSGVAVISSRMAGSAGSAFMYTGLITAGCSGLLGVFWAFNSIKYAEKRRKIEETRRFEAYRQYLLKCADKIKVKYEHNKSILQKRYPSIQQIIGDGNDIMGELWSRNLSHEDFITHRLGTGNLPFQVPIVIPKDKFSLIEDTLAEKPTMLRENYKTLYDVPIGVDLIKNRLVGIVGGKDKVEAYSIMYDLVAQIATQNCYTDVKMVFICKNGYEDEDKKWDFSLWLPHVWSENKKFRFVAYDRSEAGDVFFELAKVMRRRDSGNHETASIKMQHPYYIMFVEDEKLIEGEVIEKYVYDRSAALGFSTIILAERYEDLPNTCECVIENDEYFKGLFHVRMDKSERIPVQFDQIALRDLNRFARLLSNVEVNETEIGGEIPQSFSFFDMYGIKKLEELNVPERWKKNRIYDSIRVLIGFKAGDQPCYLDLHEKYHGPHGLVAGTTGSGKSETLQTYMISLALNFSPEDVGFLIIDYKGGGMGNLFSNLPHVLGQISNLSGNQIRRAMVSIKSENLRRQRLFNENGVNNINSYTTLFKNGEIKQPIPHLFIVIDEFAELKREEPDFMRELISVAQVGRSLGVHLILATQKPAGTVDDNIWSNAKFHLCLRVQDRQDSMDMLHKPDAAYLTSAGRGYLQVGNDEIYEQFQSGWSGAPYDEENGDNGKILARMLTTTGKTAITGNYIKSRRKMEAKRLWIARFLKVLEDTGGSEQTVISEWCQSLEREQIEYPFNEYNLRLLNNLLTLCREYNMRKKTEGDRKEEKILDRVDWILDEAEIRKWKLPEKKERTQLNAIVDYLAETAKLEITSKQPPLWLPALPEKLYLSKEKQGFYWKDTKITNGWSLRAEVGLCDDPVNQLQNPLIIDFKEDGNHAICGIPMSGKSTFLQTLIYSLLNNYSPDALNIYILDFSSRILESFEAAPQIGGILCDGNFDAVGRFFNMLEKLLQERKKLFKGGNYNQYILKNGMVCPAVLVVIDNMAIFREKTEMKYDDILFRVSRECAANGIYLLISSAFYGMSEIPNRLSDNIRRTICLEMQDKFQYADALNTMHIDILPESGVAGRGLVKTGDGILEFQTCLALESSDDYERLEQIRKNCGKMSEAWKGKCAKKIPSIPEKPVWEQFRELDEVEKAARDIRSVPIGYEYETADIYSIDLSAVYCFLLSGKSRSGKTNLLKIMIRSAALKKDAKICIVDFNSSELENEAKAVDGEYINTTEIYYQFMLRLIPVFQERNAKKKVFVAQAAEDAEVFEMISQETPYFIFIADLVEYIKMIYSKEDKDRGFGATMTNLFEKGSLLNIYFIACFDWEKRQDVLGKSAYEAFVRYKQGIHLGGNADGQRALEFPGISMQEKMKVEKAGYGLAPSLDPQKTVKIVTPLAGGIK